MTAKCVKLDEIWQEYDCPVCGIDFDLWDDQLVFQGEKFYCSGCGGEHAGGVDGPTQTIVSVEGQMQFFGIPKDEIELSAWKRGMLPP